MVCILDPYCVIQDGQAEHAHLQHPPHMLLPLTQFVEQIVWKIIGLALVWASSCRFVEIHVWTISLGLWDAWDRFKVGWRKGPLPLLLHQLLPLLQHLIIHPHNSALRIRDIRVPVEFWCGVFFVAADEDKNFVVGELAPGAGNSGGLFEFYGSFGEEVAPGDAGEVEEHEESCIDKLSGVEWVCRPISRLRLVVWRVGRVHKLHRKEWADIAGLEPTIHAILQQIDKLIAGRFISLIFHLLLFLNHVAGLLSDFEFCRSWCNKTVEGWSIPNRSAKHIGICKERIK